jgi:hypothetical protein
VVEVPYEATVVKAKTKATACAWLPESRRWTSPGFMGHSRVTTTLAVYAHLFDSDDANSIAALEAMSAPVDSTNVVRLRRSG